MKERNQIMHLKQRVGALLLTGLLALPLAAVPARAAGFTDLPTNHWAYEDLTEAAGLGILQGTGGGAINPTGTLSWGQFLAMTARTFAPDAYDDAVADGDAWDQAGYTAAVEARLLRERDGLPVSPDSLGQPVTRQDAAVVLANALPEEDDDFYSWSWSWETRQPVDPTAFTDWQQMDELHQDAVAALAGQSVITGKADGSFGYADSLQRADGAVLILRVLEQVDDSLAGQEKYVTLRVVDSATGAAILPDQQVELPIDTQLITVAYELDVGYYNYDYGSQTASRVSSACDTYTLYYEPMSAQEIQEEQFWDQVEQGTATWDDYYLQDFWLTYQGENPRKCLLLFGDQNKRRFANRAEAEASMTTVIIPVWKLVNGQKAASTMSLSVHSAIAQDVVEIFTEIYNDPEQFPIHDVGGYSWRGDTATGEHNCGTAIDINANENYQIRDGQVLAGSCWEPETNPYSISPDSSVVRIFAEHGWSWGGDAWAYSSDDSEGYHDYMNCSCLGEKGRPGAQKKWGSIPTGINPQRVERPSPKESLAEFAPAGANEVKSVFRRDMCAAENTSRPTSVRFGHL